VTSSHYIAPDWFTHNVFNRMVALLTRAGVSVWGSRVLRVRGRRSGAVRETPVNLLVLDGARYVVAPRGATQWVRNRRAAGGGELTVGRTTERFRATELPDDQKPDILRAYLRRWGFMVGAFFDGARADSTEEDLRRAAPRHPVFRIEAA